MEIKINELQKVKTMQINLFKGNRLYSFNKGVDVIIVCQLSDVNFENDFAIDSKSFDLIKKFSNPDLELIGNELIVKEGKKKFKTKTFKADLPEFNTSNLTEFSVNYESLKIARKFTSNKDIRPVLTAINLKENGNIYATDSFVLYRNSITDYSNDDNIKSINIPNTFVDILEKPTDDNINIKFNNSCVMAKFDNLIYIGRLIMGDFPKLSRSLRNSGGNSVKYDLTELKSNIEFANNVGTSKENNGNIICRLKNNQIRCYGASEYENEIDNISYDEDFDLSIVIDKIVLLLSVIKNTNNIELKFGGSFTPIICENDNQTIVITPIRQTYSD